MYNNVGEKIKKVAIICAWIDCTVCIIAALISFSDGEQIRWLFLLGAFLSFVLSWPLYGFGQLIDDVSVIRQQLVGTAPANDPPICPPTENENTPDSDCTHAEPAQHFANISYPVDKKDLQKLHSFIEESRQCKHYYEISHLWASTSFTHPEYLQSISDAIASKVSVENVYTGTTVSDISNFCDSMERLASRLESQEQ